jgi:hypothetical protein
MPRIRGNPDRDFSATPGDEPEGEEQKTASAVSNVAARELYSSPNGDRWYLARDRSGRVLVRHEPNLPSGGRSTEIDIGLFLRTGRGPEHAELLRLIGTLVAG